MKNSQHFKFASFTLQKYKFKQQKQKKENMDENLVYNIWYFHFIAIRLLIFVIALKSTHTHIHKIRLCKTREN